MKVEHEVRKRGYKTPKNSEVDPQKVYDEYHIKARNGVERGTALQQWATITQGITTRMTSEQSEASESIHSQSAHELYGRHTTIGTNIAAR